MWTNSSNLSVSRNGGLKVLILVGQGSIKTTFYMSSLRTNSSETLLRSKLMVLKILPIKKEAVAYTSKINNSTIMRLLMASSNYLIIQLITGQN
jgi:hypothetical protein